MTAQQSTATNRSWDLLRQLQAREKLEVERKTANKKVSGEFVSLSDTELVIERKRKNERFNRDEVKNIWRVKPPSLKKRLLFNVIGGGLGYISVAVGARALYVDEKYVIVVALIILAAIPVGAGLFEYLVSRKMTKHILIYSAP
jgi:hypothetical protein